MNFWIYKCNSRDHPNQVVHGDWDGFFTDTVAQEWGSTEWVPALAQAKRGDVVLAYQTNRNELVGVAKVTALRSRGRYLDLILTPVEELRVKVRPLKKSSPAIERIQALQPGPIHTLYSISPTEAKALLRAAKAQYSVSSQSARLAAEKAIAGGGFGSAAENRKVEQAAVRFVRRNYEDAGWRVRDVSASCCGYDLECKRLRAVLHVEVKGTRGPEKKFILTRNEADTWQRDSHFQLALVTNALRKPTLFQWRGPRAFRQIESTPIAFVCVPSA
jgi:hypothetical protein